MTLTIKLPRKLWTKAPRSEQAARRAVSRLFKQVYGVSLNKLVRTSIKDALTVPNTKL